MLVRSDAVAVALVCHGKDTFSRSYCDVFSFSDSFFTPGTPVTLHFTLHLMRLVRRVPVQAAVRPFRVVELHRFAQCLSYLPQAGEGLSMQQLVLDSAVDAFGHRVVLRIAVLGHAGDDVVGFQHVDVCRAGVLGATVGVVDQGVREAFGKGLESHLQSLDAVGRLKGRRHVPTEDALAVGIHDDGEEHEGVALGRGGVFYLNIGDVADPDVVGPQGDNALDEVGVGRQVVAGVRGADRPHPSPQIEPALVHDAAERVAPHTVFIGEPPLVHPPQFVRAYLRVFLPRLKHELNHELLQCKALEQSVLVPLVKGLSCHTGQCTKAIDGIPPHFVFVQPFDCPVPAFFRISMLNISSATSIIVS